MASMSNTPAEGFEDRGRCRYGPIPDNESDRARIIAQVQKDMKAGVVYSPTYLTDELCMEDDDDAVPKKKKKRPNKKTRDRAKARKLKGHYELTQHGEHVLRAVSGKSLIGLESEMNKNLGSRFHDQTRVWLPPAAADLILASTTLDDARQHVADIRDVGTQTSKEREEDFPRSPDHPIPVHQGSA